MATSRAGQVDLRVLGPVTAHRDGEPIGIAGRQGRLVLVVLAVGGGRVVDRERLIADVWGPEPPASARNALQGQISALRRALGAHAIETSGTGYRLQGEVFLDAVAFVEEVKQGAGQLDAGDPATALRTIERALARWHGPPFGDVGETPFVLVERARLEEVRLTAVEDRLRALLQAGREAVVVAEVEALVLEHPFRERLRGIQMSALYRSGRQADALAAFDVARRLLAEELGVDPGPELRDLHQRILGHDEPVPARRSNPTPRAARLSPAGSTFGRDTDVEALLERLAEERLVTLVGAGGIGKSHLALLAAHRAADGDIDGIDEVHLVRLADSGTVEDVPATACAAMGLHAGHDPGDALLAGLQGRRLLVVWDNFEHVLGARVVIEGLLAHLPAVRHLVSSRVALGLHEESRFPVAPLVGGDQGAATEMFIHRARRLNPSWALTPERRNAVHEVIVRCGGLPLAIELAASRLAALSVEELLEELAASSSAMLATRAMDLPARQRTMVASVDWSLDLLEADIRRRLPALTVFRGGFTLPAAAEVWGLTTTQALPLVEDLLDHSLLTRSSGSQGSSRFALHEPIRDIVTELTPPDQIDLARQAHAGHYSRRFGTSGTFQYNALGTVETGAIADERSNVRQAVPQLIRAGQAEEVAALLVGVHDVWYGRGPSREMLRWNEEVRGMAGLPSARRLDCDLMMVQFGHSVELISLLEQTCVRAEAEGEYARATLAAYHLFWAVANVEDAAGHDVTTSRKAIGANERARDLALRCPEDHVLQANEAVRWFTATAMLSDTIDLALFQAALQSSQRNGLPALTLGLYNNRCESLLKQERFEEVLQVSGEGLRDPDVEMFSSYWLLLSQRALAGFFLGLEDEGRAQLAQTLTAGLTTGRPDPINDDLLRVAATATELHPVAAAEALGMTTDDAVIPAVRRRLATLPDLLGSGYDAAVERGRLERDIYGLAGAGRRWLARLEAAGVVNRDSDSWPPAVSQEDVE